MHIKIVLLLISSVLLSGCTSLLIAGAMTGAAIAVDTATMVTTKTIDGVATGIQGAATVIDLLHMQPPPE